MATVLLAVANDYLRAACRQSLARAGHTVAVVDRPLDAPSLSRDLTFDVVCLDDSDLGRRVLVALAGSLKPPPAVGVGLAVPGLRTTLRLPLETERFVAAIEDLTARVGQPTPLRRAGPLTLDRARRLVLSGGRQALLTRTQLRLFETLLDHRPDEVPVPDILRVVWGYEITDASGIDLVRSHVRNLRSRLANLGLADAVRGRRGRGYAIVL